MSKAVLISIKPKWVEKIASGEKTVEVRRTAPQLSPPFKCYIYATKATKWFHSSGIILTSDELLWLSNGKIKMCDGFELWADGEDYQCVNGKVIGEFATLCNKSGNRCANCRHYLFDNDGLAGYRRWCDVCHRKPLARALGSWCYVEVYK